VLLRGINIGPNNRIAMPALRSALEDAGFASVSTYLQSGNVVLDSELDDDALTARVAELIAAHFELDIPIVVRDGAELAEVVAENPFPEAAATNPKRFQVTFLSARLPDDVAGRVHGVSSDVFAPGTETISLAISRRNVYGWHPQGVHVSKLARELSDRRLGVTATARNWTTVMALLDMVSGNAG